MGELLLKNATGQRGPMSLVGVGFAGPDDANPVIGEFEVNPRYFNLFHMTADAIAGGDGAGSNRMIGTWLPAVGGVAVKTVDIIGGVIADEGLVGIVAIETGDPILAVAEARAPLQAVSLKTHIEDAAGALQDSIPEGTVASAAEFDQVKRGELSGVEDGLDSLVNVSRFHGGNMFRAGTMASFASDTGEEAIRVKLVAGGGSSGVASEAGARLRGFDAAAERVRKVETAFRSQSKGESMQAAEITDAALIKGAILPVKISLADFAHPEFPGHRNRD